MPACSVSTSNGLIPRIFIFIFVNIVNKNALSVLQIEKENVQALFSYYQLQNQFYLSVLHFNSYFKDIKISGTESTWSPAAWLSLSIEIKMLVIHLPENYLNKITNSLSAQLRSPHCFSVFWCFPRKDLSISCWLLDWLQWDSLKILKKIRNPVEIKHKLLSIMCLGY